MKDGIQEEIDGLNTFAPGGNCSQVCFQFRADLIRLLHNNDALISAMLFAGGLDNPVVDSSRLIHLISGVPPRLLFPLYRVLAVETNIFAPGGFIDRLEEAVQHIILIAEALPEPPATIALAATATPSLLDQELAACNFIIANIARMKTGTSALSGISVLLTLVGAGLSAAGETQIHKTGAIWGWAGVSLQNNRTKKIGLGLQGIGTGLNGLSSAISTKVRHCAIVAIQAEARDRQQAILDLLADAKKIEF